MPRTRIDIATRDGLCPTWVMIPDGEGPWPGVIMVTDAAAIRPASIEMAARLSGEGYVVLLPDVYYRYGPYETIVPKLALPNIRETIGPLMATTGNAKGASDAGAWLDHLDGRTDVAPRGRYGIVGYCMGGGIALAAAGTWPDRIAAAASLHGGGLASDSPESPHLLVPAMRAELYIGVADADPYYPPEMGERLTAALDETGLTYRHELYAGAAHGWTQTDFPVYDEPAAERAWGETIALFRRTIG